MKILKYNFSGIDDDLRFVKCEAVQYDADGNLLFAGGSGVISRQIAVTFAPQPLLENLEPFIYSKDQDVLQIDITFSANPVPENNQAIWHMGTQGNEVAVQAGDTLGEKFQAIDLIVFEHNVTASLIIKNLSPDDENQDYYLKVVTVLGEQSYPFRLQMTEQYETTSNPDALTEIESQSAGLSGGAIAGIVILIIIILALVGFGVWCKLPNKFCFEPKNPNEQKPKKQKKRPDSHTVEVAEGLVENRDESNKTNSQSPAGQVD